MLNKKIAQGDQWEYYIQLLFSKEQDTEIGSMVHDKTRKLQAPLMFLLFLMQPSILSFMLTW